MAARVFQNVVQLALFSNPNARVYQSVVQLVLIPSSNPVFTTPPATVCELPCMNYLDNTGALRDNFPMKGKR